MPPSIFRTPDFSNQFPFPLEVRKIGIPLYNKILESDWLSPAMIWAKIGQCNWTVYESCLSKWTVRVRILIPNRTFLVRFGGISGEFGRAMVRIPMVRPNELDMLPKRTKKVRLGIYRTQIRPKTRCFFFQLPWSVRHCRATRIYTFLVVNTLL